MTKKSTIESLTNSTLEQATSNSTGVEKLVIATRNLEAALEAIPDRLDQKLKQTVHQLVDSVTLLETTTERSEKSSVSMLKEVDSAKRTVQEISKELENGKQGLLETHSKVSTLMNKQLERDFASMKSEILEASKGIEKLWVERLEQVKIADEKNSNLLWRYEQKLEAVTSTLKTRLDQTENLWTRVCSVYDERLLQMQRLIEKKPPRSWTRICGNALVSLLCVLLMMQIWGAMQAKSENELIVAQLEMRMKPKLFREYKELAIREQTEDIGPLERLIRGREQ